jgi:predicted transcriptional regulator
MKVDSLSKAEMEVMAVLWRIGRGSVADIRRDLGSEKIWAYTTVATYLSRMVEKGAVVARKDGRSYTYEPAEQRSDFRRSRVRNLARQLFDGRPSSMVSYFIETGSFTEQELDDLRQLIDDKARRK